MSGSASRSARSTASTPNAVVSGAAQSAIATTVTRNAVPSTSTPFGRCAIAGTELLGSGSAGRLRHQAARQLERPLRRHAGPRLEHDGGFERVLRPAPQPRFDQPPRTHRVEAHAALASVCRSSR